MIIKSAHVRHMYLLSMILSVFVIHKFSLTEFLRGEAQCCFPLPIYIAQYPNSLLSRFLKEMFIRSLQSRLVATQFS